MEFWYSRLRTFKSLTLIGILIYELMHGLPPWYSENPVEQTELIMEGPLLFPPFFSQPAMDLLLHLLDRDPERRLSHPTLIKQHEFFSTIDWLAMAELEVEPPLVPKPAFNIQKLLTSGGDGDEDESEEDLALKGSKKIKVERFEEFTFERDPGT